MGRRDKGSSVIDTGYMAFAQRMSRDNYIGKHVRVKEIEKTRSFTIVSGEVVGTYKDFMVIETDSGYRTAINYVNLYVRGEY